MGNIFNDLNKLVNTVQKVDKLLTEKPKRTRIKSVSFTKEEISMINTLSVVYLHEHQDEWIEETPHIKIIKSLIEKTKNESYTAFSAI